MIFLLPCWLRALAVAVCLSGVVLVSACSHRGRGFEVAYVSAVQANLRDRVAAAYEKVGVVKNGERVEVLDRDRRFVKVRTSTGATGWIEQRYLVSQEIYDQLQQLMRENQNDPVQGTATTRNDTNLHVEPGRETEHLYQISMGEKVSLLRRGVAEKPGTLVPARPGGKPGEKKEPEPVVEDWWLVRDSHNRVGWVLGRMIDVDLPLDVAQYAEGQRIVAYFVLNQAQDGDKKVPQYLTVVTEPKDGMPFDFNQLRVFTWNVKRHRYETAYRERLEGMLPVTVGQENFDKEGVLPVFTIRVRGENGNLSERKYKLNTPIVRRVYAPGEEPARPVARKVRRRR